MSEMKSNQMEILGKISKFKKKNSEWAITAEQRGKRKESVTFKREQQELPI